jgi:hypothetical protein
MKINTEVNRNDQPVRTGLRVRTQVRVGDNELLQQQTVCIDRCLSKPPLTIDDCKNDCLNTYPTP